MTLIKDMKPGDDNVSFNAMITHCVAGKTNGANKSNYLSITFSDQTGTIDAKLWNAQQTDMDTLKEGAVVEAIGDIIKYSDQRQMKIVKINHVSFDQSAQIEYLQKAPMDADKMIEEIKGYISSINNVKLYTLTKQLFEEHVEKIKVYPAASKNHHEYVSGLAYHTLSMLKLSESIVNLYPSLNKDLIYAGITLHDIGKTVELSGPVVPNYTLEGNLLGHISIANAMMLEKAKQLNIEGEEVVLLSHIILSHHGKNEFGSPVVPKLKEAEVVSMIDNLDARIVMIDKALSEVEEGEFTKRIFSLENRSFYKPKK